MRGRGWCDGTLRSASRSAASRRESICRAGGGFARGEGRGRATRRTGRMCVLWCMCPSMIGGREWSATVASKGWDRSRRRVSIAPAATVRSPWIRSGVRRAPPPPPASRRPKERGTRAMPVGDSCNRLRERGKEGGKEAGHIRPSGLTDPLLRDSSPKPTNPPTRGQRRGRRRRLREAAVFDSDFISSSSGDRCPFVAHVIPHLREPREVVEQRRPVRREVDLGGAARARWRERERASQ